MLFKYINPPTKYYNIKTTKNLENAIINPRWVILQYVNFVTKPINTSPYAIIVNENNYEDVISKIAKQHKVLIIGERPQAIMLYKNCRKRRLKCWIFKND